MESFAPPPLKVQTISGEAQLRHFGTFMDHHLKLLKYLLADDNVRNYHHATGQSDPIQCGPITIDYDLRHEELALFQLVNTNNKVLNKIVCAFGHLCMEAQYLREQSECFQLEFLRIDASLISDGDDCTQQDMIVRISEQLDFLCDIQYLIQRCLIVSADIFKQLGAFFADTRYTSNNNTTNSVQLNSVFTHLAEIAMIFVTFGQILKDSNIHENWPLFLKSINSFYDNIDQFRAEYNESDISGLKNVLGEMELLFNGDLFQMFMDGLYGVKLNVDPRTSTTFGCTFLAYIKTQLAKIEKYPQWILNDFTESRELIKINLMCALSHNIFAKMEASTYNKLFELNGRYCGNALMEHVLWHPEAFLERYVIHSPKSSASKAQAKYVGDASRVRQEYLRTKLSDYRVTGAVQKICLRVFVWTMKVRDAHEHENIDVTVDSLNFRCLLILDGIQMMGEIIFLVKSITNLHIYLNTIMSKSTLANVCRMLEHFKIIKMVYNDYLEFFIDSLYIVCQHMSYQALSIIQLTTKKFTSRSNSTSYNERDIDILSALQLSEKCMFGSATAVRTLITRISLSISDPVRILSADHLDKLNKVLANIEALIDLRPTLRKYPDTTFMYWHQSILQTYLKQVLNPSEESAKFWSIYHTPKNSANFLSKIHSLMPAEQSSHNFTIDTNHLMRTTVLSRICSHIENKLRLYIHPYMHDASLGDGGAVVNHTTALIHLNPLQLNDSHFLFKNHIEHYLSKTFYNLTAVSLSDGRQYGEMRSFAKIKYDLNMVDDQLPTETLEQGLDLLDLMRLINDFVVKFVYDMNNQVFIQAQSNNNYLCTVTASHIVNSLRTHGIGIMNTAINCSYKLLCQKMPLISKFLYTDKVRSGLSKNIKLFEDNKERMNQMYGYDLAKNFVKNMQKLNTDLSFVDFLAIITQIGNIMGYVRLIRSAGIKYIANASIFLPSIVNENNIPKNRDIEIGSKLADLATESQLSDVTCEAAWNLKINIINLSKDFVIKPDYFRSLLQAFTEIIRDPKNYHLKYFYISVPSLTILFVDTIIRSKENKHKNAGVHDRHVFTDDGFAMGLAYILIILNQVDAFYALDWFESIRMKYSIELAELQKKFGELTSTYEDEKLKQTLLLTVKRIQTFSDEFEMLRCNLGSAIRYFQ